MNNPASGTCLDFRHMIRNLYLDPRKIEYLSAFCILDLFLAKIMPASALAVHSVPLHMTTPGTYNTNVTKDQDSVWPAVNNLDVDLELMVNIKLARDARNWPLTVPFDSMVNGRLYRVVGSPDLSVMQVMMLGINNPQRGSKNNPWNGDDGQSKCVEVWFDELRLSQFDEHGGTAALGEAAIKLADLGKINLTGSMHTAGWGTDRAISQSESSGQSLSIFSIDITRAG